METTTTTFAACPVVRPATATRISIELPGSDWRDSEVVLGTVIDQDEDSLTVTDDETGEDWTLFDVEQADARCVVTVL